jgi:uncharacterized membrane protein YkoI
MFSRLQGFAAGAVLVILLSAPNARGDDDIKLSDVPKPVLDAVKARFPGAELTEAEKEVEGDETVYEIELKHKGQEYAVSLTPAGKILEIEREVEIKDLPKAVAEALAKKYPGAKLEEAEEVTAGDKRTYEVEVVLADKKELEVTLDAQGKILETKTEDEDDDDDKKDKK